MDTRVHINVVDQVDGYTIDLGRGLLLLQSASSEAYYVTNPGPIIKKLQEMQAEVERLTEVARKAGLVP